MNKDKRLVYSGILCSFVFIYVIIYRVLICNLFLASAEAISVSYMILLASLSGALLGYRKYNNNKHSSSFIKITIASVIVFFISIYAIGLISGYLNNAYSMNLLAIVSNVVFPMLLIIASEMFRYIFVKGNKNNKKMIIIVTVLLFLFDLNFYFKSDSFESFGKFFTFVSTIVLPLMMKHGTLSYFAYHGDYKAPIIYRCITELYVYVMPLQPNLNNLVSSVVLLALPFVCLLGATKIVEGSYTIKTKSKQLFRITDIPIILVFTFTICAVFGIGPYKLIGIETPSMTPKYKVGDGVIIDREFEITELKVGDVIAYKNKDGDLIIHRITKVNVDNSFVTQGDANPTPDPFYVDKEQVTGVVRLKIPFIAYPALLFK